MERKGKVFISLCFHMLFSPWEKNGKTHILPWAKMGLDHLDPPPAFASEKIYLESTLHGFFPLTLHGGLVGPRSCLFEH